MEREREREREREGGREMDRERKNQRGMLCRVLRRHVTRIRTSGTATQNAQGALLQATARAVEHGAQRELGHHQRTTARVAVVAREERIRRDARHARRQGEHREGIVAPSRCRGGGRPTTAERGRGAGHGRREQRHRQRIGRRARLCSVRSRPERRRRS